MSDTARKVPHLWPRKEYVRNPKFQDDADRVQEAAPISNVTPSPDVVAAVENTAAHLRVLRHEVVTVNVDLTGAHPIATPR